MLAKYPISMQTTAIIYSAAPFAFVPQLTTKPKVKHRSTNGPPNKPLVNFAAKVDYHPGPTHSTHDQPMRKVTAKSRPKSARPTRNSEFPVSSAFSEVNSEVDYEVDNASNFDMENIVDKEAAKLVIADSTVLMVPSQAKQPKKAVVGPKSAKPVRMVPSPLNDPDPIGFVIVLTISRDYFRIGYIRPSPNQGGG